MCRSVTAASSLRVCVCVGVNAAWGRAQLWLFFFLFSFSSTHTSHEARHREIKRVVVFLLCASGSVGARQRGETKTPRRRENNEETHKHTRRHARSDTHSSGRGFIKWKCVIKTSTKWVKEKDRKWKHTSRGNAYAHVYVLWKWVNVQSWV